MTITVPALPMLDPAEIAALADLLAFRQPRRLVATRATAICAIMGIEAHSGAPAFGLARLFSCRGYPWQTLF